MKIIVVNLFLIFTGIVATAQNNDPKLTEIWKPVPPVVTPGATSALPPSDAVVLFAENDLTAWQNAAGQHVNWSIEGDFFTVKPGTGAIRTRQAFGDCQLHIEWRTLAVVKGKDQGRGNSGIFLMGRYEVQVLDSYENPTYVNGQAASIYKQHPPLVNASRKPGEWQTYDILFTAPRFYEDGRLQSPARITVIHNGVLVQHNVTIWGGTEYIGIAKYEKHDPLLSLMLQDHGDLVSFRNIWIRKL